MKEQLYAEYVKRARYWGKKLVSAEEFFASVEQMKDLCAKDPLEHGLTEDAWELILS